jgi:hypothetical protein
MENAQNYNSCRTIQIADRISNLDKDVSPDTTSGCKSHTEDKQMLIPINLYKDVQGNSFQKELPISPVANDITVNVFCSQLLL